MYLIQELLRVASYRQTEAIKRLAWIHSLMLPAPGFKGAQVCRFLGNPSDYMVLRQWDSEADWDAFRQTPDGANYPKSRPEGLYEAIAGNYFWELVVDSRSSGTGGFFTRSVYAVAQKDYNEFIANRRRHDELALHVPGTLSLQTFRLATGDAEAGNFLVLARRRDREAYNEYLESPQAQEYRNGTTPGLYRPLTTECYEVVAETLP
jgi:heme-degrading monooxygenase HmoA